MNTRLAALALVTLATFATACDPELAPPSEELELRADEIDIPPPKTGGTIIVKGGHDWDLIVLGDGYDHASLDYQLAFQQIAHDQGYEFVVKSFLGDERTMAECPWICEEQHMSWNEGVEVSELRVELGTVRTVEDEIGLHWESEVFVSAQTSCGCEGEK